ncbi:PREDICTED: uncharacterized protein LOC108785524 [Nanorana parkeri]|uniref:uncharacterized protein LOC108785524 n=1 Tax=Nanorana parkeri TaxID=125878 RepID=UPI0008541D25|nr:PREDICTED: uncharacterized protein LOC108785524 [Nanorana parkeri]
MDTYLGIEVGAEVELNDGTLAVEDLTPIKLENKRDLPLWQHLHHFDDSSSDESLDQEYVNFTPSEVKTLEMTSHVTNLKSQVMENDHMEKSIYVLSTAGNVQPGLFYINGEQREDNSLVLNNANSKDLQEQPSQLAPYLEEPLFSCTEVISDFGQLQPYAKDVCMETTTLSYEEESKLNLGKFSYSDARPQRNRSFNPLGRSYKCQRCGRQFGRLYNLEHHICIEMAVGCPQQSSNNVETMNRLEKMCAEAQKELQTLQGQYKKEVVSTQPSLSEIQTGIQEPHSGLGRVIPASKCTVPCDHNECESRSICSQEFQNSCVDNAKSFALQNLNVLGNTIVVDLSNYSPIFLDENQGKDSANQMESIIHPQLDQINREWAHLNQHLSFQASEENPVDATNTSPEATKIYKCQDCGKVYNTRCSITNHMHWHKKKFMPSTVNPCVEPSLEGQESHGTGHHVGTPTIGLKKVSCVKPTQTFICEYCGKVFDRRCSYATHIYWHVKKKDPVTVIPTQEAKQETGQVSVLPIKKQNGDGACTSPVETFTCQRCGRVFNRHCAYVNHSRWHLKEQELLKGVKAGGQTVLVDEEHSDVGDTKDTLDHDNVIFDADLNKGVSDTCLDDDNVQGYCRLVGQLSLDEQHNLSSCEQGAKKIDGPSFSLLPMQLETNQQPMPEVLESVLELVVGTEEVHEILLSKAGLVFRKAEDYGSEENVVKDDAQVSEIKLEPEEKQVAGTQLEPAEEQIAGTQLEPAEEQVSVTQLEPAEKRILLMQLEPAEEQVSLMQLEPAEKEVSLTWLTPAEEHVSVTQLEPAEKRNSGMQLEPAEKRIPAMQLEPAEKWIPGMQLEPAEKPIPAMQSEPARKAYSLQILPSKLAAKCLSRPKPPHRCRDCGVRFYQFWRLKQHRLKGFGKTCTLKKHQCDCSRTPIGSLHFLLHQLQHLSDTAFICEVCSKSLRGYRQLQAHSWVHPLVSQFLCKCGTRFTKLPRYLWHSLKNKAKPKAKLHLRGCTRAPLC